MSRGKDTNSWAYQMAEQERQRIRSAPTFFVMSDRGIIDIGQLLAENGINIVGNIINLPSDLAGDTRQFLYLEKNK